MDELDFSLERLCRRHNYSTYENQTAMCGYICPENNCIYKSAEKKVDEILYKCMNLDKRWRPIHG